MMSRYNIAIVGMGAGRQMVAILKISIPVAELCLLVREMLVK